MKFIQRSIWIVLLTLFALIIPLLEVLAYQRNTLASILISRIWLVWTFYTFVYGGICLVKAIAEDLNSNHFWGIFSILFFVFISSFGLENFPYFISADTTVQLNEALTNWKNVDFGYTDTIHLGVPARGYLLASLPTLLFGPSIFNYRIMYLGVFIFGVLMFYSGLILYYGKRHLAAGIFALILLSVLSFPVVQHWHRFFDVPIFPMSFLFMSIGFLLITLATKTKLAALAFAWGLTMLANTYITGLSAWVLMTAVTSYLTWRCFFKPQQRTLGFIFAICILVSVVFGVNSFFFRQDVRLTSSKTNIDKLLIREKITKVLETYRFIFVDNYNMYEIQQPFLGYVMFLPTVLYLTGGILGIWGKKHTFLSIWVLATITISGLSNGYSDPPPTNALYRELIIIPIILLGITDILISKKVIIPKNIYLLSVVIITGYTLYTTFHVYDNWRANPDLRIIYLRDTLKTLKNYSLDAKSPIRLFTNSQDSRISYLPEHVRYFLPEAKYDINDNKCPENIDLKRNTLVYSDQPECLKILRQSKLFLISQFRNNGTSQDPTPAVFRAVYIAR